MRPALRALGLAAAAAVGGLTVGAALTRDDAPEPEAESVTVVRTVTASADASRAESLGVYHRPALQALVPPGADVVEAWTLAGKPGDPSSVAVAWASWTLEGSTWGLRGVSVWQRHIGHEPLWTEDAVRRTRAYEISGTTADLTGDGRRELLLREETGGTAGCGIYRLLAPFRDRARVLLVRALCQDDGTIRLGRGGVVVREGVGKDPRTLGMIHCCALKTRTTLLRWDGRRLAVVERKVRRRTGPPG